MTKIICDRCGVEITITSNNTLPQPYRISRFGKVIDLCKKCQADFDRWMENTDKTTNP